MQRPWLQLAVLSISVLTIPSKSHVLLLPYPVNDPANFPTQHSCFCCKVNTGFQLFVEGTFWKVEKLFFGSVRLWTIVSLLRECSFKAGITTKSSSKHLPAPVSIWGVHGKHPWDMNYLSKAGGERLCQVLEGIKYWPALFIHLFIYFWLWQIYSLAWKAFQADFKISCRKEESINNAWSSSLNHFL